MGFTRCTLSGCLLTKRKESSSFESLFFSRLLPPPIWNGRWLSRQPCVKWANEAVTNPSSYCRRLGTGYESAVPPWWLCFYFLQACQRSSLSSRAGCSARCCLRAATGSLFKVWSNTSAPSSSSSGLTLVFNTTLPHAPCRTSPGCIGPPAPHRLAPCWLISVQALHSTGWEAAASAPLLLLPTHFWCVF